MKPGLGMLKDRRVQLAAVAAAALGLFTLARRGGGGGGATIQPAAGLDTSASDLLSALTDLGQGWQQDLRDIKDRLPTTPDTGTGVNPRTDYSVPAIPQQGPRSTAPRSSTGSVPTRTVIGGRTSAASLPPRG